MASIERTNLTMWIFSGWLLCGVFLGTIHAMGLSKTVNHGSPYSAVLGIIRLLTVGTAFVFTAILGGIVPLAIGWAIGFFPSVGIAVRTQSSSPIEKEIAP